MAKLLERNNNGNGGRDNSGDILSRAFGWLRDNFSSVVLPILAIMILAIGIYVYSTPASTPIQTQPESTPANEVSNETPTTPSGAEATESQPEQSTTSNATPEQPTVTTPEATSTTGSISEMAARGDGITHLARRALKSYLETRPGLELTKEHKIYIEDYLQNQKGTRALAVGETMEFGTDMIASAVTAAQQLSPQQLQHLSVYAAQVLVL